MRAGGLPMTHVINNVLIGLNNIGRVFCDYAAGVFVQSALLVILLLVVELLLRKRVRAVFRYCLWMLVLVKLVLPPMLSLPTGIGYWVGDHLPAAFSISDRAFDVARLERMSLSGEMPQVRPPQNITEIDALSAPAASALTPLTWQAILFVLWLVGVFAFLVVLVQRVRFVRGLIAVSRPAKEELLGLLEQCRQQIGVRWDIRLRVSETIPSPAVCGFFRPTVLIPAPLVEKLSPEGLRATLIHELAHIKRGDLWVNSVQTFLQVIYFYNPFVWLANSIIRRVCEEAVDETVLVTLGGQAKNYSNTLIDIGEMAFWRADLGLRLIGVAESKKALQWRIKHMLNRPIPKNAKVGVLGTIVIIIIAAVLLPMAKAEKSVGDNKPVAAENEGKPTKLLYQAVADGNIEQVKLLISKGYDVNAKNKLMRTALHYASEKGHTEVARLLISHGAYVNATNSDARKPLHYAAMRGDKQTVELLLSKGADINAKDRYGSTPLFEAMTSTAAGRKEVVELLVAKGAKVPALHLAAYMGDIEKLKKCLQDGMDINSQGNFCCTALHLAANSDKKDIVEFLISKGARVDAKDAYYGVTPLYYAVRHNYEDIADLLLAKGADVNAKDKDGHFTLLYYAIWDRSKDAIKLLISRGANVNVKDDDGYTPLVYAIWENDKDMVELLISKGADVNAEDNNGYTPYYWAAFDPSKDIVELLTAKGATPVSNIHLASYAGDLEKVKSFIEEGTDVNAKDKFGRTPLFEAVPAETNNVAEFLIAKGADVNARDNKDQTPLHIVGLSRGKREMVELLISKGADVNAKNNRGVTPLHSACVRGQKDVAELLIAKGANLNAKITGGPVVGWTPLHFVAIAGHTEVVGLLIAKGADVNIKDNNSQAPLHGACLRGHKDAVELLIAKGADMNANDNKQQTALSLAKEQGHSEIVELLRKHGAKE